MTSPRRDKRILSDAEIDRLIRQPKLAPRAWRSTLLRDSSRVTATSEDGATYVVFSQLTSWCMGLVYVEDGRHYNLMRLDGPARRRHRNPLEGVTLAAGSRQLHRLTERYQQHRTAKPDQYAEVAPEEYDTPAQALDLLARLAHISVPGGEALTLWEMP